VEPVLIGGIVGLLLAALRASGADRLSKKETNRRARRALGAFILFFVVVIVVSLAAKAL
jgi:hypothetical protein